MKDSSGVGRVRVLVAEAARREARVHVPTHSGRVNMAGRSRGLVAHHDPRVATGDDSISLAALLMVLTQQHVSDVVGRRGRIGSGDAVTRKVVHVRHGLLRLSGCGQLRGRIDGLHVVHAVHVQEWRVGLAVVLVVTDASASTPHVLVRRVE